MTPNGYKTSVELRNERASIYASAKQKMSELKAENRSANGEEKEQINRMLADVDRLKVEIEDVEREEKLASVEQELRMAEPRKVSPAAPANHKEYSRGDAFRAWLLPRETRNNPHWADAALAYGVDINSPSLAAKDLETRAALIKATGSSGGHTAPTEDLQSTLIRFLEYESPIFNSMRRFNTSTGVDMPIPQVDDTGNDAVIVSTETTQLGEQSTNTFSQITLKAWQYTSKRILVSKILAQDTAIDLEGYLMECVAKRFARAFEQHLFDGNGSSEPEGLQTFVSTADVDLATAALTYAKIVDMEFAVERSYRPNSQWLIHDDYLKTVKKIVSAADDRPLFEPSLQVGTPDRLLGYPITVCQGLESGGSVDDNPMFFGDFNYCAFRTVNDLEMSRNDQLYWDYAQIAWAALWRVDFRWIGPANSIAMLQV